MATVYDKMSRVKELSPTSADMSSQMAWRIRQETDKLWRDMASRPTELPRILKEFRTRSGYTQEQTSEALGLRLRDYQRYEAGHNLPRRQTIERIAKTLKLPTRAFYPTRDLPPDELGQYVSEQEDALQRMEDKLDRVLRVILSSDLTRAQKAALEKAEAVAEIAPKRQATRNGPASKRPRGQG